MAHFCYNRLIGQCKISYDLYSCRKIRKVILVATTLKIEKKNVDFSRILQQKHMRLSAISKNLQEMENEIQDISLKMV